MKVRHLVLLAMFIALSMIGAQFKLFSTMALDACPGFLAALLINPLAGLVVGALGHLFTALSSGFPMGILVHGLITFCMGLTMYLFGVTYQRFSKDKVKAIGLSSGVALAINVGLTLLILTPILGVGMVLGLVLPLSLTAGLNLIIAFVLQPFLAPYFLKMGLDF